MEVTVVGGGIVGCSAAALLAESGCRVTLVERDAIAAAASGRNQGTLQHPLDDVLAPLYHESMALHRQTIPELARPPEGLLLVTQDSAKAAGLVASIAERAAELSAELVEDARVLEPALACGTVACRVDTGHVVEPVSVTTAWARRAQAAGARIVIGGEEPSADVTLRATGPWAPAAVTPVWGVTVQLALADPPRHALEEAEIEGIATLTGALPSAFSAVQVGGTTTIGSTFLATEPDPVIVAPTLVARARAYLPGIASARLRGSRACARPVSPDGRPLVGRVGDRDWIATGNGPWGMSCGPATARVVVDAILGRSPVPAPLVLDRF